LLELGRSPVYPRWQEKIIVTDLKTFGHEAREMNTFPAARRNGPDTGAQPDRTHQFDSQFDRPSKRSRSEGGQLIRFRIACERSGARTEECLMVGSITGPDDNLLGAAYLPSNSFALRV
jgi:hypothetical protein